MFPFSCRFQIYFWFCVYSTDTAAIIFFTSTFYSIYSMQFFIKKIEDIRTELNAPANLPIPQSSSYTGNHLTKFNQLTHADVKKLVMSSKTTSCDLDPMPTSLLKDHITILTPIITKMINLSLQTGEFPTEWKLAFVKPLLKKPGLATTLKITGP